MIYAWEGNKMLGNYSLLVILIYVALAYSALYNVLQLIMPV